MFIPYNGATDFIWAPSEVDGSLIEQLHDLALKSPIISTKPAFPVYLLTLLREFQGPPYKGVKVNFYLLLITSIAVAGKT